MFTATTVKVLRPTGLTEEYVLSLGGGDITPDKERQLTLLQLYAASQLHSIELIKQAQSILVCSGYGLSNVILLEASPAFTVEE